MSDGTAVRTTRMPLISPTSTPSASDAAMPTMIGAPKWPETIATVIAPAGIIEPIEMSSSPAIIRRPIGSATMPRFAATLR